MNRRSVMKWLGGVACWLFTARHVTEPVAKQCGVGLKGDIGIPDDARVEHEANVVRDMEAKRQSVGQPWFIYVSKWTARNWGTGSGVYHNVTVFYDGKAVGEGKGLGDRVELTIRPSEFLCDEYLVRVILVAGRYQDHGTVLRRKLAKESSIAGPSGFLGAPEVVIPSPAS